MCRVGQGPRTGEARVEACYQLISDSLSSHCGGEEVNSKHRGDTPGRGPTLTDLLTPEAQSLVPAPAPHSDRDRLEQCRPAGLGCHGEHPQLIFAKEKSENHPNIFSILLND